ncbi:MAG: hypothetical protein LC777_17430 [Actinobacteria bacterium]|nr:hypothetical protein [Actinomycetota bacterium]
MAPALQVRRIFSATHVGGPTRPSTTLAFERPITLIGFSVIAADGLDSARHGAWCRRGVGARTL